MSTQDLDLHGFTVTVEVTGGYHPATWGYDGGSPAEGPEIDILGIQDDEGTDCTWAALEEATGMSDHAVRRWVDDQIERQRR